MRYLVVAFWAAVFGEILGYVVSQLGGTTYSPLAVAIVAVVVGEVAITVIPALSDSGNPESSRH